ncbi:FecR family protein [Dyadobacter sp. CY323]|uniref:FecR family protein n=1 Tax=Dyadobacter sp. CY323 TaxID=2907302 RepID=UPI001F3804AC|nr:FecR family protein [Dyadobacter sp. CY323]MCE6989690.1 FecR family protein [Dyadobacter sp. CY323]
MINKTPSPELLRKYLANECTDSELRFVDEWYRTLHLQSGEEFTENDEEKLLLRIRDQISDQETVVEKTPGRVINWKVYLSGIAAALILSLGFLYYNLGSQTQPVSSGIGAEVPVKMVNLQKKIVRYELPDNSIVWIQPGASIEHPRSFNGKGTREVKFEGEGFFNVAKDRDHPFIIHSGRLKTEVVGTSFNVRANRDEKTYQVSVVTGSVSVSSEDQDEKVLLKPSQQAVFEPATNDLRMANLDIKKNNNETWQPVSLTFDDVPLQEITERLQKIFRVKISITNPVLKQCVIKVGFDHQNLPEILEMINTLLGSTYEIDGDHIVLSGEGCGGQ